jgi:hypothetical protein
VVGLFFAQSHVFFATSRARDVESLPLFFVLNHEKYSWDEN